MNPCKSKRQKEMTFPAKVFGYLALCQKLKQNTTKVSKESELVKSDLPFVSSITSKFTPCGAIYTHWSFLQY